MNKVCTECNEAKPVSEFCRHKSRKDGLQDQCKACQLEYRQRNKERIAKSDSEWYRNQKKWQYECQHCHKIYVAKNVIRDKYCSRECYFEYRRANPAEPRVRGIAPVFVSVCVVCGTHCKSSYCSDDCQKTGEAARALKIYATRIKELFEPRVCKECSKQFVPEHGSQVFCDLKCSKRHGGRTTKATRRARIQNSPLVENINPLAVLSRDKWKCHLCGRQTPRRLRGTIKDNAPEMDHIIPLAKGGAHTWDNVACACRKCNSEKGDRIIGQQLLPVFASIAA